MRKKRRKRGKNKNCRAETAKKAQIEESRHYNFAREIKVYDAKKRFVLSTTYVDMGKLDEGETLEQKEKSIHNNIMQWYVPRGGYYVTNAMVRR